MSIFDEFKGLMSDHLKDVRKEMEKSLREVRKDIRSGWNGDDDYYDDNDDIFGRSRSLHTEEAWAMSWQKDPAG